MRLALEVLRRPLTSWDRHAAASATAYLANSQGVADRIWNAYGIHADVVPPPIMIDANGPQEPVPGLEPGFLLSVSRMRGYKNAAVVCDAVEALEGERLVAVGGLPERPDGRSWGDRLVGVSGLSDAQLRWLYANCDALMAVSHEDFGLTPLEANSFGKPAVCLEAGGYLDTLRDSRSGVFVHDLSVPAVIDAVQRMRSVTWSPMAIKWHANRFSPSVFAGRLWSLADEIREARSTRPTTALPVPLPAQRRRLSGVPAA